MNENQPDVYHDDRGDSELDRLALNIAKGIHHRARQRRLAEIEHLEAETAAEWQRVLDQSETT